VPAVSIRETFVSASGTLLTAAHVSGTVALLLQGVRNAGLEGVDAAAVYAMVKGWADIQKTTHFSQAMTFPTMHMDME
jgi:subtilisin family serine protease